MGRVIDAGILVASLVAGVLGALLGLGGGIIIVPVLTLLFGIDIRLAIGASVVSVIATSSGAAIAFLKDGSSNLRLGMFLNLATTSGALVGALLVNVVPKRWLFVVFGALLTYSAFAMLQRRNEELPSNVPEHPWAAKLRLSGSYYDQRLGQQVPYVVAGVPAGFGVMYGAGVLGGLLGIGSGAFNVLGLDMVMRLPMKVSTSTSNFMIGVTAAASAGVYFGRGDIAVHVAAPVALGVLAGALLGARIVPRMRAAALRKLFIPVLLFIGLQMAWKGVRM